MASSRCATARRPVPAVDAWCAAAPGPATRTAAVAMRPATGPGRNDLTVTHRVAGSRLPASALQSCVLSSIETKLGARHEIPSPACLRAEYRAALRHRRCRGRTQDDRGRHPYADILQRRVHGLLRLN